MEIPLIAFRPVAASEELLKMVKNLHTYDWMIFTSNVTVETFFSFLNTPIKLPKTAVIGEKTREVLGTFGIEADFTPGHYVAEDFVAEFSPLIPKGSRILIPKGNLAREHIASTLKRQGMIVDEVVIYETYLPDSSRIKLIKMIKDRKLDILTFTSPSTIDHFMEIVRDHQLQSQLDACIVGCIGPVSKRKAEEWGMTVHAAPAKYTVEEMLKSIIDYLQVNPHIGG